MLLGLEFWKGVFNASVVGASAALVACDGQQSAIGVGQPANPVFQEAKQQDGPRLDAAQQLPARSDARVAYTDFNATAEAPCRGAGLEPGARCLTGVIRRADRSSDLIVRLPDGSTRTVLLDPNAAARPGQVGVEVWRGQNDILTVALDGLEIDISTALLWGG